MRLSRVRSYLLFVAVMALSSSSYLLFVAVMALSSSSSIQGGPSFDHLVVFGDSLSDMGNAGRFSNGPVWVEQLATLLKVPLRPSQQGGQDFAVGGARIGSGPQSLRAQTDQFLKLPRSSGRTLYIVWGGGNDVLAAIGDPDALTLLNAAAASLRGLIADLIEHGASDVLVPSLPDVGITPEVRAHSSKAVEEARTLTQHFNKAVEKDLADVEKSSTRGFTLYRLDVEAMGERVRRDPASFGFTDISRPCRGAAKCGKYLFWDEIHPTTDAHARLAEAALRAVSPRHDR
jgi:phospholipase/lecithinase/hemolysin